MFNSESPIRALWFLQAMCPVLELLPVSFDTQDEAIDASSDIWALNLNANLDVLTGVGGPVSGPPYNTNSSTNASNFALDGFGNA
jgi:hypothetical protein